MAIFGSLEELPIPEILNMLGQRSGHLKVSELPNDKRCDLYLDKGRLKGLRVNGKRVEEIFEVREEMVSLMSVKQGTFEFSRAAPATLQSDLDMSVQQLLLSAATAIDEIAAYRNNFAAPQTRFQALTAFDTWADQELAHFWRRSEEKLRQGTSAEELAQQLSVPLESVQLSLYKLRSLGFVEPVRQFRQARQRAQTGAQTGAQPVATVAPFDPNDTVDRALRDAIAWDISDTDEAVETTATTASERPREEKKDNLVARMLKALSFGKRS